MSYRTPNVRESLDPDATRVVDGDRDGFFGRDREVAELQSLLAEERLIGVYGPPGVGKSRLSRLVVRSARAHAVCSLDGIRNVREASRVVAERLGALGPPEEEPAATRARLARALAEADPRVVLLDDADHLRGLPEFLSNLVARGPSLTFVVTTRARLPNKEAHHYPVRGLSVSHGRKLFVEDASKRRPDFEPDAAACKAIDALVEAVDGLPFAIRLAASRTTVMSPRELLRRASSRLEILKTSQSTNPRHVSLRGAMDWSWEQIDPTQQRCLAICSVFENDFSLAAAEFLAGPWLDRPLPDVLEELIECSLLQTEFHVDEVRFAMLACVREYARERLAEYGWEEEVANRRAEFLHRYAADLSSKLEGEGGREAFAELTRLQHELGRLLRRYVLDGDLILAARLLVALRWNVLVRGPLPEYEDLLRAALEADETTVAQRAELAATLAEALMMRGDRLDAAELASRELARVDVGAEPRAWLRLTRVWSIAESSRRPDEVRRGLEEALDVARDASDRFMEARLLERLGFMSIERNEIDRAWLSFADAREMLTALGAELFLGEPTAGLGYVELRRGEVESAAELFEEAVRLHDAAANHFHGATARFNLGVTQHAVGRIDDARTNLESALRVWKAGGFVHHRVPGLVRLGLVLAESQQTEEARSTLSEALQLGEENADHHNAAIAYVERAALDYAAGRPVDVERLDRMVAGIGIGADPDAFASALTLFTAVAATGGAPTLPYVNRIEELVSLFAEDDSYMRHVVRRLRDVARAWHALAQARHSEDEDVQRQHVARAFEWAADLIRDDGESVSNPFVRLWARRLGDAAEDLPDFAPADETFRGVLRIHRGGDWYRLDDRPPIELTTRRPLRLIMQKLAEVAEKDPGRGLDVDELARAGWPGEPLSLSVRRNRVYTAIRFLREMDLEELLVTSDAGYRFAGDVAVRLTDEPPE